MSNLLDLSGKIEPRSLTLFVTLSDVAGSLGVAFFLVGATARDMIFELGYERPSRRATLDRDFGVRVSSWAEFEKLKYSLLTGGLFKETSEMHDYTPVGGKAHFRFGLDTSFAGYALSMFEQIEQQAHEVTAPWMTWKSRDQVRLGRQGWDLRGISGQAGVVKPCTGDVAVGEAFSLALGPSHSEDNYLLVAHTLRRLMAENADIAEV